MSLANALTQAQPCKKPTTDDIDFTPRPPSVDSFRPSIDILDLDVLEGESERTALERLGRQRPESLTAWQEIGFVFSIVMSQALNEVFISSFTILIPTVVQDLDIPTPAVLWPTNAFTIVVAACLIPCGRITDIYGGFWMYIGGLAWLTIMALVISFSPNEIMLNICRAFQGLGPAAYLPAGLTLLGNMYRPGPKKNIIFSIYGSMAPLGFYIGMFFAGLVGQYSNWPTFFWIWTGLSALTTVVANYSEGHAQAYKNAFWFEVALGAVSLVVFMGFLWIEPAKADYTADEKSSIRESIRERESIRMSVEICGEAAPDDSAAAGEDGALSTTRGNCTAALPAEIDAADFAGTSVEDKSASAADDASKPKEVKTPSPWTNAELARQGNDVYLSF